MSNETKNREQILEELTALQKKVARLESQTLRSTQEDTQASQLAAIVESSDDAIIGKDADGTIVSWNRAAERIYGYTATEVKGVNVSILAPPERRSEMATILERMKTGEHVRHFETERVRKDGRRIFVSLTISPLSDASGAVVGASTIARDITEHKRAEIALREFADEIQDLYNKAPCGYHSVDTDGTYVRINDTELTWLGCTREQVIRKRKFSDFLAPGSMETYRREFTRFKEQGWVQEVELELARKDGSIMTVLLSATTVRDNEGNYIMSRSTIHDITDHKRAEKERETLIEQLRNALSKVKALSGLLPICASCKKIRSDKGYWENIETYISAHADVDFSHGICPECAKKLYPDYYKENK